MRAASLKEAIALTAKPAGPVAALVAEAVEIGFIVPSILRTKLEAAGYTVVYRTGPRDTDPEGDAKVGAWVSVTQPGKKGPLVVARAFSHDKPDALLQAVYAWMKEEAGVKSKDAILAA